MLEVNNKALIEPDVLASVPQLLLIRTHGRSLQLTRILLRKKKAKVENENGNKIEKRRERIISRNICFNFTKKFIRSMVNYLFLKTMYNK